MLRSRLAELRQRRGLRQGDLAAAAGVSRQALSALEAGRSGPSMELALRLAAALGCRADELFWIDEPAATIAAELAPPAARPGERVAVVSIDGRWVAHGLPADASSALVAADGVVEAGAGRQRGVQLLRGADEVRDALLCVGCAPALGILAARVADRRGPRVVWLERTSEDALGHLARGHAHIAGAHLLDDATGEYNVPRVRALMPDRALRIVELARWEAGLVVAAGNPKRLRGVADLARRGVTVVRRDAGAGAEVLLRRLLRQARVPRTAIASPGPVVHGHLDVARAVALGAADAGVAIRSAAIGFGLAFVPLAEERFDLVLGSEAADDPRVVRLLDALTGRAFRRDSIASAAIAPATPVASPPSCCLPRSRSCQSLAEFALVTLAAVVGLAAGCKKSAPEKAELKIFAAASLREAFTEFGTAFEKAHPGVTVAFQFAGSQELRAQIEHGADVDVFASADTKHMGELEKAGSMVAPVIFARNEPVVVVAKDKASSVALFTDLTTVSRLVVGAPDVPIGRYTDQILKKVGETMDPQLKAAIESKIVSRELNVRQVLAKVSLGEADAGIVYRTDAAVAGDKVTIVAIPRDVNVIAEYPIAVAKAAPHAALAKQFVELVTSAAGQETLQRRGFLPAAK